MLSGRKKYKILYPASVQRSTCTLELQCCGKGDCACTWQTLSSRNVSGTFIELTSYKGVTYKDLQDVIFWTSSSSFLTLVHFTFLDLICTQAKQFLPLSVRPFRKRNRKVHKKIIKIQSSIPLQGHAYLRPVATILSDLRQLLSGIKTQLCK